MRRCLKGKIIALSLVGLGGFLIGGALGVALGSKDEEEDSGYIPGPFDVIEEYPAEEIYSSLEEMRRVYSSDDEDEIEEEEAFESRKMKFVNQDGDEVEMRNTSEGFVEVTEPYVISEDEFVDPNIFGEFERNTLIYYEEDDVLATDRDEVIKDVEEMIGSSALTNFGYKSGNADAVFVRNVKLGVNFEVLREQGSYQELVLGLPEEDTDYEKAKKFFRNLDDDGR